MKSKPSICVLLIALYLICGASYSQETSDGGTGDESCESDTHCVIIALVLFEGGLATLATQAATQVQIYNQLGLALAQANEGNATHFSALNQTLLEISRVRLNERHLLAEKEQTLAIKRDINDQYGVVAEELGLLPEVVDPKSGTDIIRQLKKNGSEFDNLLSKTIRGTGTRTAMLEEFEKDPLLLVQNLTGDHVLEKNDNPAYSLLIKGLVEGTWYPTPVEEPTSDADRAYASVYRDRQMKLSLASSMIHDYVAQRMYVIDKESNSEFFNTFLREANGKLLDGVMSDARAVRAMGLSQFGSNNSYKISGLSGDELQRKYIFQLSINNYLRSKYALELKKVASLRAASTALAVERTTAEDMTEALFKTN